MFGGVIDDGVIVMSIRLNPIEIYTCDRNYFFSINRKYMKRTKAVKIPRNYLKIIRINDNELMAIIGAEYWRFSNKTNKWSLWETSLSYSYGGYCYTSSYFSFLLMMPLRCCNNICHP